MIHALVGDLFESTAQTLVNTVNCVGVMGKGIALEFKNRFPEMYQDYVVRCERKQVRLGEPYLYRRLFPPQIINFPTKDHWRSVSNLSDIVAGLDYLEAHYHEWGITSLAVPPLGCGQGQLEWRVVGPTLYRHLSRFEIPVELYAPLGTPDAELDHGFLGGSISSVVASEAGIVKDAPRIEPAWVALVEILARIEREPYHWPVGRTRFQKLAYFADMSGVPTGLSFRRASYGPFAPEAKSILTKLVNNGLLREEVHGRMLVLKPGPTFQDAARSSLYRAALDQWEPLIDQIVDLLQRIPTNDTEIAATVHFSWLSLSGGGRNRVSENEILQDVKQWKQRRNPPIADDDITDMIYNLAALGWIDVIMNDEASSADEDLLLSV